MEGERTEGRSGRRGEGIEGGGDDEDGGEVEDEGEGGRKRMEEDHVDHANRITDAGGEPSSLLPLPV